MVNNKRSERKEIKEFFQGIGTPEKVEFVPDQFQLDSIQNLADGFDTLVIAPTGAGKTFIAIEAIKRVIEKGQKAIYTTPLKALSNSKYAEFKRIFSETASVGLLTGDRKIDGDSSLVVATTEIYRNELYSLKGEYGLVVLDEVHYLADMQRGAVWEESIILSPRDSSLLMLSASISNADEIASWISEVRKKEVKIVASETRPVELRLGFLHPRFGVIPLMNPKGDLYKDVSEYYRGSGKGNFFGPHRNRSHNKRRN